MIITISRKPVEDSTTENVKRHQCGGINIEGTRIGNEARFNASAGSDNRLFNSTLKVTDEVGRYCVGRFPSNVIVQEATIFVLDQQSGVSKSTGGRIGNAEGIYANQGRTGWGKSSLKADGGFGDVGGASRYFKVIS